MQAPGRLIRSSVPLIAVIGVALWVAPTAFGATATATYVYSGSTQANGNEQTFVVPAGVSQITFLVRGAAGGAVPSPGAAGGTAAQVTGTLNVTPGQTLYVEVGGTGGNGGSTIGLGGFNGGAIGGAFDSGGSVVYNGAGGGGASDIRTVPRNQAGTLGSRLVIAAGGGGGGAGNNGPPFSTGGAGGNAFPETSGTAGGGMGSCPGGGGQFPVTTNGGAGGVASCDAAANGVSGSPAGGSGGAGGPGRGFNIGAGGGGGGGGWYGGGGGAGGGQDPGFGGGGGGGGGPGVSMLPPAGATQALAAGPARVEITYTVPEGSPPPPAQGTGIGGNPGETTPPPEEGAQPPPPTCTVPVVADGTPRTLAQTSLMLANAGCATGRVDPNPITLKADEPYVVWAQKPGPDETGPLGTPVDLDLVTVFWFQTQQGLAKADEIKKALLNGADKALAQEIGMQFAGDISEKVHASIAKNLPGELKPFFGKDIAAELVARLTLPIDGLLGGAFGSIITKELTKFLGKVMPDELKAINKAVEPVAEFADRVENEVNKFFAPAGQFLNDIKQQVDGFLDKNLLDPIKDAITKPLQEAIGKPIQKIFNEVGKAISDTIGKPINAAIQSVKKFGKQVGCSIKKLFGGKKC